jgi:Domain of unknown function (DUF6471)
MARPSEHWQQRVRGLLKAELARRDVTYTELVDRLAAIGVKESEQNIANKLSRGTFTAAFFVQCLDAIGCRTLRLDADE